MNEVLGCLRKVMVNDVCDVLYVNAVRNHIHRDYIARGTAPPKSGKCRSSLGLRTIPWIIAALIPRRFRFLSNLLCAARNLKSAGEDYSGVVNTHFVPNSASTIDFPHENGAGP